VSSAASTERPDCVPLYRASFRQGVACRGDLFTAPFIFFIFIFFLQLAGRGSPAVPQSRGSFHCLFFFAAETVGRIHALPLPIAVGVGVPGVAME
jgi:hypothetical protein